MPRASRHNSIKECGQSNSIIWEKAINSSLSSFPIIIRLNNVRICFLDRNLLSVVTSCTFFLCLPPILQLYQDTENRNTARSRFNEIAYSQNDLSGYLWNGVHMILPSTRTTCTRTPVRRQRYVTRTSSFVIMTLSSHSRARVRFDGIEARLPRVTPMEPVFFFFHQPDEVARWRRRKKKRKGDRNLFRVSRAESIFPLSNSLDRLFTVGVVENASIPRVSETRYHWWQTLQKVFFLSDSFDHNFKKKEESRE